MMTSRLCFFLILAASAAVGAVATITAGQNNFTISRPEGTRNYYVWVPTSYISGTTSVPLLLAFHGADDTCYNFANTTGFNNVAQANNFLVVYPCATTGPIGTAWNAGMCCLGSTTVNDTAFALLIIQQMQANFRVNAKQIFISGFSNGAMFTEVMLCQYANLFAGGAAVSGVVEIVPGNIFGIQACDALFAQNNKTVNLFLVHGTSDLFVPYLLGNFLVGFPPVPQDFAAWGARLGCQSNPVNGSITSGPYTSQIYNSCASGSSVTLVTNNGGAHVWAIDQYFNATAAIWNFFSKIIA